MKTMRLNNEIIIQQDKKEERNYTDYTTWLTGV